MRPTKIVKPTINAMKLRICPRSTLSLAMRPAPTIPNRASPSTPHVRLRPTGLPERAAEDHVPTLADPFDRLNRRTPTCRRRRFRSPAGRAPFRNGSDGSTPKKPTTSSPSLRVPETSPGAAYWTITAASFEMTAGRSSTGVGAPRPVAQHGERPLPLQGDRGCTHGSVPGRRLAGPDCRRSRRRLGAHRYPPRYRP